LIVAQKRAQVHTLSVCRFSTQGVDAGRRPFLSFIVAQKRTHAHAPSYASIARRRYKIVCAKKKKTTPRKNAPALELFSSSFVRSFEPASSLLLLLLYYL